MTLHCLFLPSDASYKNLIAAAATPEHNSGEFLPRGVSEPAAAWGKKKKPLQTKPRETSYRKLQVLSVLLEMLVSGRMIATASQLHFNKRIEMAQKNQTP